jgi:flavin reductase (DIM6/NTAB) family NADH-FMN oxidoreductase RutF
MMAIDPSTLRQALGCFATGVTVVTGLGANDEKLGVTASSFNSVSLDPPLVLFSLNRRAYSMPHFLESGHFAVNVLREGQEDLADRFATPLADKWDGIRFDIWDFGCPILSDALANFECRTRYTYDGGDHVIFVGEIERMRADLDGHPLLFYGGRYQSLDTERA